MPSTTQGQWHGRTIPPTSKWITRSIWVNVLSHEGGSAPSETVKLTSLSARWWLAGILEATRHFDLLFGRIDWSSCFEPKCLNSSLLFNHERIKILLLWAMLGDLVDNLPRRVWSSSSVPSNNTAQLQHHFYSCKMKAFVAYGNLFLWSGTYTNLSIH